MYLFFRGSTYYTKIALGYQMTLYGYLRLAQYNFPKTSESHMVRNLVPYLVYYMTTFYFKYIDGPYVNNITRLFPYLP